MLNILLPYRAIPACMMNFMGITSQMHNYKFFAIYAHIRHFTFFFQTLGLALLLFGYFMYATLNPEEDPAKKQEAIMVGFILAILFAPITLLDWHFTKVVKFWHDHPT